MLVQTTTQTSLMVPRPDAAPSLRKRNFDELKRQAAVAGTLELSKREVPNNAPPFKKSRSSLSDRTVLLLQHTKNVSTLWRKSPGVIVHWFAFDHCLHGCTNFALRCIRRTTFLRALHRRYKY